MTEPELVARLETDADGQPAMLSGTTRPHFFVAFEVRNAPPDTYAATFELSPNDPNPVRTLTPAADGTFRVVTTTNGDFPIVVRLRNKQGGEVLLKETVARALRRNEPRTQAYTDALDYIAAH